MLASALLRVAALPALLALGLASLDSSSAGSSVDPRGAAAPAAAVDASWLADWMGNMGPVIANKTVLDLSLPGSHDTMTYDLSTAMSDGYEGLPSIVTTILHALTPLVAGEFIRDQGRTQGLNITEQLEGGLRFIDFRIMYTSSPAAANQQPTVRTHAIPLNLISREVSEKMLRRC